MRAGSSFAATGHWRCRTASKIRRRLAMRNAPLSGSSFPLALIFPFFHCRLAARSDTIALPPRDSPVPKIFFCYRRDDSMHPAGRIFDHLAAQFGKNALFKDVDSMPIGLDYRRVLADQVADCDVLLAIVGDDWLTITDPEGHRRLDNT